MTLKLAFARIIRLISPRSECYDCNVWTARTRFQWLGHFQIVNTPWRSTCTRTGLSETACLKNECVPFVRLSHDMRGQLRPAQCKRSDQLGLGSAQCEPARLIAWQPFLSFCSCFLVSEWSVNDNNSSPHYCCRGKMWSIFIFLLRWQFIIFTGHSCKDNEQ